jgi:hypothetical protein
MISVRLTDSMGRLVVGGRRDPRATAWTSLRPCVSSRQSRRASARRLTDATACLATTPRRSPHHSESAVRAQQSSIAARDNAPTPPPTREGPAPSRCPHLKHGTAGYRRQDARNSVNAISRSQWHISTSHLPHRRAQRPAIWCAGRTSAGAWHEVRLHPPPACGLPQ